MSRPSLQALDSMTWSKVTAWCLALIGVAVGIRLFMGWHYFGFMYGDELEVQQLTLSRLIGFDFELWALRNTTYPLVFVYPMQALWHLFGVRDPGLLVYAGRVLVTLISGLNIWLVYRAMRREPAIPVAALLAVLIFALEKKAMVFGSTVLPRNVTTTFVLIGYIALGKSGARAAFLAGAALGLAAALRFSEVIFLVPAGVDLILRRRWSQLLPLGAGFTIVCGAVLAISDWIYWGRAFASLEYFAKYTLLEGKSTHGFQPLWYYAERVGKWVNLMTFSLAVAGVAFRRSRAALWVIIPMVLLSLLPHKEARYMLPVLPFLAILAGEGAWRILQRLLPSNRRGLVAVASLALVTFWLVSNIRSYPFPRSEDSVRAARLIARQPPTGTVAFEAGTGSGGGIYMTAWEHRELLPPLHGAPIEEVQELVRRKDLACIALRARTLERIGGEPALRALGWSELTEDPDRGVRVFMRSD